MGASQQSVEWKLKHEEKYIKKIKEENQIKNTICFSSPYTSIFGALNFIHYLPISNSIGLMKSDLDNSYSNKNINEIKKYNLNIFMMNI